MAEDSAAHAKLANHHLLLDSGAEMSVVCMSMLPHLRELGCRQIPCSTPPQARRSPSLKPATSGSPSLRGRFGPRPMSCVALSMGLRPSSPRALTIAGPWPALAPWSPCPPIMGSRPTPPAWVSRPSAPRLSRRSGRPTAGAPLQPVHGPGHPCLPRGHPPGRGARPSLPDGRGHRLQPGLPARGLP